MSAQDVSHGGVGQPATRAVAVTPDDNADLGFVSRALYIGGAGNVEVVTLGGDTAVFTAVPVGTILPVRATRVKAGLTTATLILSLF